MRVIDIHSHFFSRPFFDALARMAPGPEEPDRKLERLAKKTGIELPPQDVGKHLQRWLKELDAHGVDHLVTFASLPEEAPAVAEAVRLAKGRVSGCTLVNPLAPNAAKTVERLMDEEGLRGVLLFPAMHHYCLGGEEAKRLFAPLAQRNALVFAHCGLLVVKLRDLLGIPRPYDINYANPLDLIPAANAAPGARFVIPHFGAGFFRETLMAGSQCENVYVDTSSSNSWMRTQPPKTTLKDVFARAIDVFGPERILFGTDSNVFPKGWQRERLDEQKQALDDLGVSDDDQAKILGGNAARLLGI